IDRESFSIASGHGNSDDVMLAAYFHHRLFDHGYLAMAVGYAWHDISTQRVVTVAGTDIFSAKFRAHDFGGRIEGGYDFALDDESVLTPYAALAGQTFAAPGYQEAAASGASTFALSYDARTNGNAHTELGAHYSRSLALGGEGLKLDTTLAWAREMEPAPLAAASFQTLAGTHFLVQGASPAKDTALLGLGLHMPRDNGLSFGVSGDARLGSSTTILAG